MNCSSAQGCEGATASSAASERTRERPASPPPPACWPNKGLHDTKIADIAAAADVGVGTFYLHFDTKEALFDALVEDAVQPPEGRGRRRARRRIDDPVAQIRAATARVLPLRAARTARSSRSSSATAAAYHDVVRRAAGAVRRRHRADHPRRRRRAASSAPVDRRRSPRRRWSAWRPSSSRGGASTKSVPIEVARARPSTRSRCGGLSPAAREGGSPPCTKAPSAPDPRRARAADRAALDHLRHRLHLELRDGAPATCAISTRRRSATSGTPPTQLAWRLDVDPEAEILPDMQIPIYGTHIWEKLTPGEIRKLRREEHRAGRSRNSCTASRARCSRPRRSSTPCRGCEAKFYGATQVMDEARHVEVYSRYLHEKLGGPYPHQPAPEDAARPDPHRLALGHEVPRHADHGRRPGDGRLRLHAQDRAPSRC